MSKEDTSGAKAEAPRLSFLRRSFGKSGRTSNAPIPVSDSKLQAINYLCGEEEVTNRCKIEILDSDQKKLVFKKITLHPHKVRKFRERVQSIIERSMPVSDSEEQNVTSRIQTIMNDLSKTVYIAYNEDTKNIELFSENWGDMDKAMKKLEVQGQRPRAATRVGRFGTEEENSEMEGSAEAVPTSRNVECSEMTSFSVQGKLLTIKVYKSSASDLRVDGIVNAVPEKLTHGTETSSLGIPVTDVMVTSGNDRNYKLVFNLVGLVSSTNNSEYLDDLLHAILRCMSKARNLGLESLAIPSLSSALEVATPEQIAEVYIRAAKSFDSVVKGGSLREVHFVNIMDKHVSALRKELDDTWSKAYVQTERQKDTETINAYLKKSDD